MRHVRRSREVRIAPQVLRNGGMILGRGRLHPRVISTRGLKRLELLGRHFDAAAVRVLDNPAALDFGGRRDLAPTVFVPPITDKCANGKSERPIAIVHGWGGYEYCGKR